MNLLSVELISFWVAVVGYAMATALGLWAAVFRKRPERTLLALMATSWLAHTVSIGARWLRIDHLPVGSTFEMLSANIWGLMLAVIVGFVLVSRARAFIVVTLPVILILMGWMMLKPSDASSLPPTYNTVWLFIHIGFIKLFLGAAFVAVGMGGLLLLRRAGVGADRLGRLPGDAALDDIAYRCMVLALFFDSLGIIAGAIWAQDAWGRYWSWDPLEIWSLLTWLSIGLTLHVRAQFKTGPAINALMVIGTFLVAFFTFFGIPFVTTALHKGAI